MLLVGWGDCLTDCGRLLPWLWLVLRETGLGPLCKTLDIGQADCLEWPLEAIARISLHLKVRRLEQELAEQHQILVQVTRQLDRLVELDGLKLAADRDEFTRQLRREWQRMIREAQPLALVLAAIDDGALYRERYGRQRSELSLRQVVAAIACFLHPSWGSLARPPTDRMRREFGCLRALLPPRAGLGRRIPTYPIG